jgi:hypothetical protein
VSHISGDTLGDSPIIVSILCHRQSTQANKMRINGISIFMLAIPTIALFIPPRSFDKRGTTLELDIFMTESALANKTALEGLQFWQTDPGSTSRVALTIDPKPGYTFGSGLDRNTWTVEVIAELMTVVYLDVGSEGPTVVGIVRSGEGNTKNVSLT